MRSLGQLFTQSSDQIANQVEAEILKNIAELEDGWQGNSRQRYDYLFQDWKLGMDNLILQGKELGQHMQQKAQQYESVDQQG
jgi:WXG100 family type VII secretion target